MLTHVLTFEQFNTSTSISTGKLAANELPLAAASTSTTDGDTSANSGNSIFTNPNAIAEDADDDDESITAPTSAPQPPPEQAPMLYTWRIDLTKTEEFWSGWFEGLSQKFLDLCVPKLLLLANIDGLDRTLTVGQMQGRFQLQVLARSGHVVHEDQPHEVAEIVASYLVRNRFARPIGTFAPALPMC